MAGSKITQYEWLKHSVLSDDGGDACKEWPYNRLDKGYGTVAVKLGTSRWRTSLVHVVAFALSKQLEIPLPKGVVVRHTCNNPPCFRLRHLLSGSQQENINDAVAQMRHTIGQRNGMVKLTEEQVREIYDLYRDADIMAIDIAARFNISFATVRDIASGKHWRHLGLHPLPRKFRPQSTYH